jgi:WD40 repeat protein
MQLKKRRKLWLWGLVVLGVFLIIFGVQVLSEWIRQTKPITYLFDQPATVPLEASDDWLRGAVWVKPTITIWSAAFSPDGQLIAVTMGFGIVGILRAQDGSLVRMLTGHRDWLRSVAFSPDGRFLASVEHREIRLWSLATWETVKTFSCDLCIRAVFSPDGRLLATGDKVAIRLGEIETGRERVIPTEQGSYIDSVEFSDDGQLIASSGGTDGTIKVWRVSDGAELFTIKEQTSSPLEFSMGGSLLASVTSDGAIKLWRLPDGSLTRSISAHRKALLLSPLVLFSPRGDLLASSSEGTIKLWSPDGRFLGRLNWQAGRVLAFSPDGKYLVSGGETLKLWRIADRSLKLNIGGVHALGEGIESLAFSPDGTMLASSVSYYKGEGVKLWKMPEGRVVRMLPTAGRALAFSSDGQLLAVAEPQAVTLWQVSDGKRVRTISESCAPGSSLSSVAFSPDGTLVAATCGLSGRMIRVWKVADGKELFSIAGDANGKGGVAFSPDGQLLSVAKGRSVKLYSASDGSEVRVLQEGKYFGCLLHCAVAFSPDGQLIAASVSDRSIKIWRVSDFQEVRSYEANSGSNDIRAIAFTPDGKTLAIAESHRDTIKLWDFESDRWIGILQGHGGSLLGWINALVVSPDGRYLASGGRDGLALWRIKE